MRSWRDDSERSLNRRKRVLRAAALSPVPRRLRVMASIVMSSHQKGRAAQKLWATDTDITGAGGAVLNSCCPWCLIRIVVGLQSRSE